jgi:uncharacterized protein YbbC (DUF1343 family)
MVLTGLDVLVRDRFHLLQGQKFGLLAHAASVDRKLVHILDRLLEVGVEPSLLLAPEHGIYAAAQDMQPVENDRLSGIPVVSLYGSDPGSLRPPPQMLSGLDALVIDLQDIGCRYYTFANTMLYCLQVCAEIGVRAIVLDRPNPLGGLQIEGPLLEEPLRSFVGEYPVPVRHGLTLGELARLASLQGLEVELTIIPLQGWRREMWFDQTGLEWVMPSPNMPTLSTATVYPGACLAEATNLSEGRGTTRPFELLGAPWLAAEKLAAELSQLAPEGARFRPVAFCPGFHKYAGLICRGVQVHVLDRQKFRPFRFGLALLQAARRLGGEDFQWRKQPYEFESRRPAVDLLCGTEAVRRGLEAGAELDDLEATWRQDLERFEKERVRFWLYSAE